MFVVIEDSIPFYCDDDYLSDTGINIVVDEILNILDY